MDYKVNWVLIHRDVLRGQFDSLRTYAEELESLLLEQSKKLEKDLQKQSDRMGEDESEELAGWWEDQFYQFGRIFRLLTTSGI